MARYLLLAAAVLVFSTSLAFASSTYTIQPTTYSWIDPSAHVVITLGDDSVSSAQNIPFSFSFCGNSYTQLYVGANGLIGFVNDGGLSAYSNTDIPNTSVPNCAIYPYWDDLYPPQGGTIRVGASGSAPNRRMVISWVGIPHISNYATTLTFQILLCEGSNNIIFQYQEVRGSDTSYGAGRSATVGVEDSTGTTAAKYSFNGSTLLSNSQAILFTPPGASTVATPTFSPDGGTYTSPQTVTVSCTTPGATIHYTTNGNDPTESDPTVASGSTVAVNTSLTLKAKAFLSGWNPSTVKSAIYVVPGLPVTPVGQWGGACNACAVSGNRAYIGMGPRLAILDISNPSAPALLGVSQVLPYPALGVVVSGNYAYVADNSAGLQIINISNPASPSLVGGYQIFGAWAYSVALSGNYAYVGGVGAGLQIINVSNPAHPTYVGEWYDPNGYAYGVAVSGNYAYVAEPQAGLQVINVANPSSPIRVGGYDTSGYAWGVAVSGGYAYVADSAGLQVIDISTPASPTRVGGCDTGGGAVGVAIAGNYAYVADGDAGLQVIDISTPASPNRVGGYDTSADACVVAVSGNYAYVADDFAGLQVIDVSSPANPTRAGGYDTGGDAYGVAVSGNYAYVANNAAGLQVLNISDPTSPSPAGACSLGGAGSGIAVVGNYAYVADGRAGLQVVNISNPASPTCVGGCANDTNGYAYGVAVSGNHAYVADAYPGLQVIDISNPASPTRVGGCPNDTNGFAQGVAVSGNYAYVADYCGLQVIDVSNPATPTRVGGCSNDTNGCAVGVAVSGNYAYVADSGAGLQVINISNPASPTRVGGCAGYAYGVAVSGNYAYVTGYPALQVIDVSNPASPVRVGECSMYSSYGVALSGDYAYAANGNCGIIVLRVGATSPPSLGSITPDSGINTGSVAITNLSGAGFQTGATVRLTKSGQSDIIATGVTVVSATQITCAFDLTGKAPGLWNVVVANPGSLSGFLMNGFVVTALAPTVTSITPNSGLNTGSVSITNLAGTYFQTGAAVKLTKSGQSDIVATGVTVMSATQITGSFNLTGKALGQWNVVVTNPDAQSGALTNGFAVTAPAPTLISITPNSGLNTGSVSITNLAGTYFQTGAAVKLAKSGETDIAATGVTVVSPTQITCAFDLTGKAAGQWNVVVTNPDAQSGTLNNGFTVTAPAPTVTSITPNSGLNTGSVDITDLAGTYFHDGTTVKLTKSGQSDIVATGVTVVSATQIICSFDLTGKALGQWSVVVTNFDAQSGTLNNGFTVTALAPTVTSITPNSGLNTGSVSITNLAGAYFQTGAAVKLTKSGQSDIVATGVTVVSATQIICSFDLTGKALGQWSVMVTNPDLQSGTLTNGFTITDSLAPVIHSVAVSPPIAAEGDPIHVSVDVTDNVLVTSVKANNTDLIHSVGSSWSGDISADSTLGLHTVTVVARDAVDNFATDTSQSYTVRPVLFAAGSCPQASMTTWTCENYLFCFYGMATIIDSDSFTLDTASGMTVTVVALGYEDVADNDFVMAHGVLDIGTTLATLTCDPATLLEY